MPQGKGTYGTKRGRPSLASQGAAERRKRDSQISSAQGGSTSRKPSASTPTLTSGTGKSKAPKATGTRSRYVPASAKPKPMTAAQVAKASASNPDAKYILTSGAPKYRGTNTPQKRSAAAVRKQTQARVSRRKK